MSKITAIHLLLARQQDPLTELTRRALNVIASHQTNVDYYLQSPEPLEATVREAIAQQIAEDISITDMSAVLKLLWQEAKGKLPEITVNGDAEAMSILARATRLPESLGITELARAAAQQLTARSDENAPATVTQPTLKAQGNPPASNSKQSNTAVKESDRKNVGATQDQSAEPKKEQLPPPLDAPTPEPEVTPPPVHETPVHPDAWTWLTEQQILEGRERLKSNRALSTQERSAVRHVGSRAAALQAGSPALEKANPNEKTGLMLIAREMNPTPPEEKGPSDEEVMRKTITENRISLGSVPYMLINLTDSAREANKRMNLNLDESTIKRMVREEISRATSNGETHVNGKGYYTNIL